MISVFTPTHDSSFLSMVYQSLSRQTYNDWEWVVVYNNGGKVLEFNDPRVRTIVLNNMPKWVGPLKAHACEQSRGDILVELDHDDLLMPTALQEVAKAFEDKEVGFVFSNSIHATGDFKKIKRFDERYGWRYREVNVDGNILDEHITFDPCPSGISRIWYAPNHLRAFRKSVYESVGGFAKDMRILDDLDLM